jgi:uncharacterized protein YbjT (DUF2867 family)
MKIVVIGGTGLIGSRTVERLRRRGHDAVAASPKTGVDTLNNLGLAEVLEGAAVVVDLADSPSYEEGAVMHFFETTARNLIAAELKAGVKHHVVLSIVGSERLPDNPYFRAKMAQQRIVAGSPVPHTIIHSTQFFEFLPGIADAATSDGVARLSPAFVQPIAADDVADIIATIATEQPQDAVVEIAGPGSFRLNEIVERYLQAIGDDRRVEPDVHARYFGAELEELTLVPGGSPTMGHTSFPQWLARRRRPTREPATEPASALTN